jgi:MFS family permease
MLPLAFSAATVLSVFETPTTPGTEVTVRRVYERTGTEHRGYGVRLNPSIGVGVVAATVSALPLLLCGGLVVLMQADLDVDAKGLGTGVATFFGLSALVAVPVGRLAERQGPRRTTRSGLVLATAALLGIAAVSSAWWMVLLLLALAGAGNAMTQLGVNLLLARAVARGRHGLAFGTKQAAIPLASLLAGVSIPIIGLSIGWRWAFAAAAVLGVLAIWIIPPNTARPAEPDRTEVRDARVVPLVLLAVGVGLGAIGGNCAAAFIVSSLVADGFGPSTAGLLLASGSTLGIAVRIGSGWLADRLGRGSLLLVVGLIAVGIVGFVLLALAPSPAVIVIGTVLAFGGGWGFAGLILLAVARTNPRAPAAAMGIVQVGPMAGSVVGPILFGWLATEVSYRAAWALMAILAVIGIALILVSRRLLLAGRVGASH